MSLSKTPSMPLRNLAGVLSLLFVVACEQGIHRVSFDHWRSRNLRDSGLIVDIPRGANVTTDIVSIHDRSNGFLADKTFFITISVDNKTRQSFDNATPPPSENPVMNDPNYVAWIRFMQAYHRSVDVFASDDTSRHYRRDVQLPDGTIASMKAEYICARFSEAERVADDAAIRRILASAKPNGKRAAEWKRE